MLPEPLRLLFGDSDTVAYIVYGSVGLFFLVIFLILWQIFGSGPRRRRAFRRSQRAMKERNWQETLTLLTATRNIGIPSLAWIKRFDALEADALELQSQQLAREKKFEDALEILTKAHHLRDAPEGAAREKIQDEMLREIRRLFASTRPSDLAAAMDLIGRTLMVRSPCREASFWLGMCDLRVDEFDTALANFQVARTGQFRVLDPTDETQEKPSEPLEPFVDPPLYIGSLHMRRGEPNEALRYFTEANRVDPSCPLVTVQLGAAMVGAGKDLQFAVRTLQRGLGARGLEPWIGDPQKFWAQALPEKASYIRRLAQETSFTCPMWGNDLRRLRRHGHLSLAQGNFRLGNFAEAAQLFELVLKEGAPSHDVLQGLGLSLARTRQYDEAFKHLRSALEMEEPKERWTVGYLALCGACGTPASEEDRRQNLAWAIQSIQAFNGPGETEWIDLISTIFAEARAASIDLSAHDQLYLCEHLRSVNAIDAHAAQAYAHLATTHPSQMQPEYAWLFCRADQQAMERKDASAPESSLALYHLAFRDWPGLQAFCQERGWDASALELAYLRRSAQLDPGKFPAILGPDYPSRGEAFLLEVSKRLESSGQGDAAVGVLDVLVRLAPHQTAALDRLAQIYFHAQKGEEAEALLVQWQTREPANPLPLLRLALLRHRQGKDAQEPLERALQQTQSSRRARIGMLGSVLALQNYFASAESSEENRAQLDRAAHWLETTRHDAPQASEPLWMLAAIRWLQGDRVGIRSLASELAALPVNRDSDPRFRLMAALCHWNAGDFSRCLEAIDSTRDSHLTLAGREARNGESRNGDSGSLDLAVEGDFLAGLALVGLGRHSEALDRFSRVARSSGPSRLFASAFEGQLQFQAERHDDAAETWQRIDLKTRQAWKLHEPLAQTLFLSALEMIRDTRYDEAGERLRHAGKMGCRDRRLGPLLLLSLFKAGQKAIYGNETVGVPIGGTA